ncbi:alpha-galactosidase [Carnobacterium gallinarum]|uniref:alpha-galactosidase n=1 Tax=Carnobacterium gallinarum TaxID=2749 RepID=UPI000A076D64|nr:alpha-galactosidase [Carnobacterium gallinarum]
MPITVEKNETLFHLKNSSVSYVIEILHNKYITHRYWGSVLSSYHGSNEIQMIDRGFATNPIPTLRDFSLNSLPLEYSTQGNGDHRIAGYQIRLENGTNVTDFSYVDYQVIQGKPKLTGLPATFGNQQDVTTLELTLEDAISQLKMILSYHLFENLPVITRTVRFENQSQQSVFLENTASLMIDLPSQQFDLITLDGSHTNEAGITRTPIRSGIQKIESSRGTSSPQHQPFMALTAPETTEFSGEVRAFHLIYSGNFSAQVEAEQYGSSRVVIGIHEGTFEWQLNPQETFQTPEAVLVYSETGLNAMSQTFHQLYQNHLAPTYFKEKERPILLNTWEANYFDLNEASLDKLANAAAEMGIELFVLDDGWFGKRQDDTSSLGDWTTDLTKLPHGIEGLAEKIRQKGMEFGLWFEPEMISKNSYLYDLHPDWALQVPHYPMTEGRRQFVLDLSRIDVQDYLIDVLSSYLDSGRISYIKWDMNRHLTEVASQLLTSVQQKEVSHRYVLGLYRILESLTTKYPHCLFENCSSGGGRFDPGMMHYMAQTWTSDNTDALSRTLIQYGYSFLYPPIMMGAHVSQVPNHQVGRITSLETRGHIAMSGNLGYELDFTQLDLNEKQEIHSQISFYKQMRPLFQFGQFFRLQMPNTFFASSWLFLNEDEAIIIYFNGLARPSVPVQYLPLHYLDESSDYVNQATGETFSGSELNKAGLTIPRIKEDFKTLLFHFKKKGLTEYKPYKIQLNMDFIRLFYKLRPLYLLSL